MLTPEEAAETVARLDKAYPNGWRCGEPTTDAITVVLASGLRKMLSALFLPRSQP